MSLGKVKNMDGTVSWVWTSKEKLKCDRCERVFKAGEEAFYCRNSGRIRCKDCEEIVYDSLHAKIYANKYGEHHHFKVLIRYKKGE